MKPIQFAQAKLSFFDRLAIRMSEVRGRPLRPWIALIDRSKPQVLDNTMALARALCRYHDPNLDNIRDCTLTELPNHCSSAALVVHAQGFPLQRVAETVESAKEKPALLVVVGFTGDCPRFETIVFDVTRDSFVGLAVSDFFAECGIRVDSLAVPRFMAKGFVGFQGFVTFEGAAVTRPPDPDYIERFCWEVSLQWRYRSIPLTGEHVHRWVQQFLIAERNMDFREEAMQILRFLRNVGFISEAQIAANLNHLYETLGIPNHFIVAFQKIGKSEAKLAYWNKGPVAARPIAEAIGEIEQRAQSQCVELVCLDDFLISGKTMRDSILDPNKNPVATRLTTLFQQGRARLNVLISHGDAGGMKEFVSDRRGHTAIHVKAQTIVDDSQRFFTPNSTILDSSRQRQVEFEKFCREMGSKIYYPKHALGYSDGRWCIATEYSVPNGTLPLIHTGKEGIWMPLFWRSRPQRLGS